MNVKSSVNSAWLLTQRRGLLGLTFIGQRLRPRYRNAPHLLTGERGEFEALFFLRRNGYLVVERRWKAPDLRGDVDLIAWDGASLCFIEVKTRTVRDLTPALSAVDETKRKTLRNLARAYRRTLPRTPEATIPIRFDVVSVYLTQARPECELLRGVFSLIPAPAGADLARFDV